MKRTQADMAISLQWQCKIRLKNYERATYSRSPPPYLIRFQHITKDKNASIWKNQIYKSIINLHKYNINYK